MKQALDQLRKIAQMTDQKHWRSTEMRERALEEWIESWLVEVSYEQSVLNQKFMTSDFEDLLKERVGKHLFDETMEEAVQITKGKNNIKGNLVCLRRKQKK
jgi:hypothetical protein